MPSDSLDIFWSTWAEPHAAVYPRRMSDQPSIGRAIVDGVTPPPWPPRLVRLAAAASVVFASLAPCSGVAQTADDTTAGTAATLSQPPRRDFGYTIGDVLVQRLAPDDGAARFETLRPPAESLPTRRVDRWLERLSATIVTGRDGVDRLELRYQVINAPAEVITAALPGVAIGLVGGGSIVSDPVPIGIGPMLPEALGGDGQLPLLRPDRGPATRDVAVSVRRMNNAGLVLAVTLTGWAGWWVWRQARDRVRLPFARARRALATCSPAGGMHTGDAPSWQIVHRAFDETAGRAVHGGSIDALLDEAPWLRPSRERIESFYVASGARFFEQPPRPVSFDLEGTVRDLARAERAVSD